MTESPTVRWMFTLARAEGLSFLTLLLVGMPLKRLANMPEPNQWIGWMHGFLFLVFLVALRSAGRVERWPRRFLWWGALGSVVPGGTFVFESAVRRRLRSSEAGETGETGETGAQ